MWELLYRLSHGRYPLRRFSLLVTTTLLTFFVTAFLMAPAAHAEDATRNGDTVTYQNNTFTPVESALLPKDITAQAPNAQGYRYLDNNAGKAHFIITSSTASQADSGYYVVYSFTPPDTYSGTSPPPVQVTITGDKPAEDGDEPAKKVSECDGAALSGIGWIICPTVNFIAKGMDKIYSIISDFLAVKTVTADINSPLYQLWMVVRDIANICFVIAILVIIYSQLTSIGISNYGIKNLLPRLIVAAILVNISYWLCAIAVDVSNILGYAIHSLFMGIMDKFSVGANYSGTIPTWEQVAAIALAGTGAVAAGVFVLANSVTGSVFLLIPVIVSAICAALVALIVLATRQALITIFIILSPLAFVAYILPNTEKYFTKWREAFVTLLVLFPIFSVIFSGAQLAGMAIIQSAGGNLFTIILGLAVQVAPIVITPMLVKFSGNIIGKVAGMLNNPNKGIIDRTRNWAQGAAAERKNKVTADQTMLAKSRLGALSRNPLTAGTKAINNYRRRVDGRRKAYEGMADNAFAATRYGQRIEGMNRDVANDKKEIDNRFADSERGRQAELRSRNLDVDKTSIENSLMRSSGGQAVTLRQELAEADKVRVRNEFDASHAGHEVDTAKREVERQKQLIHNQHEQEWHFRNLNDAGSQEQEMRLRIATDKAAAGKARVDAVYNELKHGDTAAVAKVNATVAADLASQAYSTAELTTLTTIRNNNAAAELKTKINNAILTNGAVYQTDASGEKIILNGKPVVIDNRTIDGKSLQEYATGISKRELTLANAVAEDRSDWDKQAKASGELIEHFKLNSNQTQMLAKAGKGTLVKVTDDSGNEFEFDAGDEYVKEAAIVKQFREGSASQKEQIINESGKEIREVDADGNVTVRQGHNYAHRMTIKNEAVRSNIPGLLPFINDITFDEIGKGNYTGVDSKMMHSLRQIFDGRVKSNNLAGASDAALKSLVRVGELASSSNPADTVEYNQYKDMVLRLYKEMLKDSPAEYQRIADSFDDKVKDNYINTLGNFKQILENSTLGAATSIVSKDVMVDALKRNGVDWKGKK